MRAAERPTLGWSRRERTLCRSHPLFLSSHPFRAPSTPTRACRRRCSMAMFCGCQLCNRTKWLGELLHRRASFIKFKMPFYYFHQFHHRVCDMAVYIDKQFSGAKTSDGRVRQDVDLENQRCCGICHQTLEVCAQATQLFYLFQFMFSPGAPSLLPD